MPHIRLLDEPVDKRRSNVASRRGPTPIQPPFVRDEALCKRILQAVNTHAAHAGTAPSFQKLLASLGLQSRRTLHEGLDDLVRTGHLRRLAGCRYQAVCADRQAAPPM